jgi:hypothetical protein
MKESEEEAEEGMLVGGGAGAGVGGNARFYKAKFDGKVSVAWYPPLWSSF